MRGWKKVFGVGVVVGAALLLAQAGQARAECAGETACSAACDGGDPVACTKHGDILAQGIGRSPDHAGALKRYVQACDGTESTVDTDPVACLAAAKLYDNGWLFEIQLDPYTASTYRDRALSTGNEACNNDALPAPRVARGCYAATEVQRAEILRDPDAYASAGAEVATEFVDRLSKSCRLGSVEGCLVGKQQLWELSYGLLDGDKVAAISEASEKRLTELCLGGEARACAGASFKVYGDAKNRKTISTLYTPKCRAGDGTACVVTVLARAEEFGALPPDEQPAALGEVFKQLGEACALVTSKECIEVGTQAVTEDGHQMITQMLPSWDAKIGVKMLKDQCRLGVTEACDAEFGMYLRGFEPGGVAVDDKQARIAGERACKLTAPVSQDAAVNECGACQKYPDLGECELRKAYVSDRSCQSGTPEACEDLGDRYAGGLGVSKDPERAALSFKNACDSSVKSSCAKLDELCRNDESLSEESELCTPSLLHTDVFYEAEWQFRQNDTATLLTGKKPDGSGAGSVTVAENGGGGGAGVTLSRGSLNADLVVSIVLDRARQAAMRLVVDEFGDRMRQHGIRTYMRDLLAQGAAMMAEATSLRRDSLQDLGMTLVRAFAASNLVRTQLGSPESAKRAKLIGPVVSTWKAEWLSSKDGSLTPELKAYFADSAYWALGAQPLLSGAGSANAPAPACPFTDARKELCTVLGTRDAVSSALRVDGVLAALNMARALGAEGGIDVRRLIEAVAQSKSIVDFAATPGLNLGAWRARIVEFQRGRLATIRERFGALSRLIDAETYSDKGPDLVTLANMAASVRVFLEGDGRALVGGSIGYELSSLLALESYVSGSSFGGGQVGPETLTTARKESLATLARLGEPWRKSLLATMEAGRAKVDALVTKLDSLARGIEAITATLSYHQPQGNVNWLHLRIDRVPLADLDVLVDAFRPMVKTLDEIDVATRDLLPGTDLRGVRFARSSAVRLLGFLDLMSRVARAGGINQTVRDVIDTLQLLGNYKKGEFTAPLYDMLQPVLDFIETRTPMPLEQLFAIVGRVRLDGLVTSLALGDSPCANEDRAECWVFKLAYSLQEAITRDGNNIKIDGAEVAKRLADFGDDFQRRNKGRWYLHLTVGAGMMRTSPPTGGAPRLAPLIAEQIGFGYATPAFWKDRLTLKAGLAGSGFLYRAVLDNEESDAVIGSAFLALDVYDVIEAYGAFNVLAYPPADGEDAKIKTGWSVGLQVPLSAYLEKL